MRNIGQFPVHVSARFFFDAGDMATMYCEKTLHHEGVARLASPVTPSQPQDFRAYCALGMKMMNEKQNAEGLPVHTRALGIDVSHHQGDPDWASVREAGVDFVFIKATEGRTYTDPKFQSNYTNTHRAGLLRGVYHYAYLAHGKDATDPVGGAQNFLRAMGDSLPKLPLVLDLETERVAELTALKGVTASADWISTFLHTLETETHRTPMLYWSHRIFDPLRLGKEVERFRAYPTWWARYIPESSWSPLPESPSEQPEGWDWSFWQFTSSGKVAGIHGAVDLNLFFQPIDQMASWLSGLSELTLQTR